MHKALVVMHFSTHHVMDYSELWYKCSVSTSLAREMMDGINFIDHLLTLEREREGNFSFGGGGGDLGIPGRPLLSWKS